MIKRRKLPYATLVRKRKTVLCYVGKRELVKKWLWVLCPVYHSEKP